MGRTPPSRLIDITGQRFGKLVVLGIGGHTSYGKLLWRCKCDCGSETLVTKDHLGKCTNSCGCIKREKNRARTFRHGETKTRLHNLWCSMKERCSDHGPERSAYYDKGIRVCDEWMTYEVFRDWAIANGYDPTAKRGVTTIDRIDNNKGYCPENCRFVTQTENARNKSNNTMVVVHGERLPLTKAAEMYGTTGNLIRERLSRGWSDEDAVLKPVRKGNYRRKCRKS